MLIELHFLWQQLLRLRCVGHSRPVDIVDGLVVAVVAAWQQLRRPHDGLEQLRSFAVIVDLY